MAETGSGFWGTIGSGFSTVGNWFVDSVEDMNVHEGWLDTAGDYIAKGLEYVGTDLLSGTSQIPNTPPGSTPTIPIPSAGGGGPAIVGGGASGSITTPLETLKTFNLSDAKAAAIDKNGVSTFGKDWNTIVEAYSADYPKIEAAAPVDFNTFVEYAGGLGFNTSTADTGVSSDSGGKKDSGWGAGDWAALVLNIGATAYSVMMARQAQEWQKEMYEKTSKTEEELAQEKLALERAQMAQAQAQYEASFAQRQYEFDTTQASKPKPGVGAVRPGV